MLRRASSSVISTLGLTLAEFQSAFDGHWGVAHRITYPGTGQSIETGDIVYAVVPTRDFQERELEFHIRWAGVKMAAIAGGAEALDYPPDKPEDSENAWQFIQLCLNRHHFWRSRSLSPG
jgi:hypothetical protein